MSIALPLLLIPSWALAIDGIRFSVYRIRNAALLLRDNFHAPKGVVTPCGSDSYSIQIGNAQEGMKAMAI